MKTVSVRLSAAFTHRLDSLVRDGVGVDRADVMRRALKHFAEQEAINRIMEAEQEVQEGKILRGNLRDLLTEN